MAEPKQFKSDDSVGYRHEIIPPNEPDCPYLERWVIGLGRGLFKKELRKTNPPPRSWFSFRLHHFFRSDEDHLHDHPTWFVTLVLKGTYKDWVRCENCEGTGAGELGEGRLCGFCLGRGQVVGDYMKPGSIRFRPALHAHRVETEGCWTLLLFGPRKRDWGFWSPEGWIRQRTYFQRYGGAAACREADSYDA